MKTKVIIKVIIPVLIIFFIIAGSFIFIFSSHKLQNPNIILITIDALRPDHLSCYGYKRNTSPNIDKLAQEGVLFTQAISQASVTIVSLTSLMTSLYPHQVGIVTQHLDYAKDFRAPTLIELLKARGYTTGVITSMPWINVAKWSKRGVDYYVYKPRERANFLTEAAMSWIDKIRSKPFFLWIHYLDTHAPYRPPPPYNGLYINDRYYDPTKKVPLVKNLECWGGISPKVNLDNHQEVDYYIAQYDGAIRYVDNRIGELLNYLKKQTLYNNSIIVITADHGEALGEHNLYFEHANTLYDELVRVPLIIKFPHGKFGVKVVKKQIELVDITPTILDYLDYHIPEYITGKSLLPLIKQGRGYDKVFAFSKTGEMNAIRTGKYKLIYYEGSNGFDLYNLEYDPEELFSVSEDEEYKDTIKLFIKELKKKLLLPSFSLYNESETIDEHTKEVLKNLGYLQ